ncbi:DUF1838 family protein [Altererythrobacter sp. GH1-8]|uniref:DUF1838 family protein n=1 Tax=Altererythrobacter sp. GH1-8 TaxID=3349333 RepID=UPI00374CCEB9
MFLRIRSSDVGRKTFWWYTGKLYGDRYGEPMRPLFQMQGASQTLATRISDSEVAYTLKEAGYYCDLETGEVIDGEVNNVFTDEAITPQHYLSSQDLIFSDQMAVRPQRDLPSNISFDGRIIRPDIKGDRIWMSEYLFVTVGSRSGGNPRISNSMANFEASLEDVSKPEGFVPATMQYTTFNSYRTWMNMGDTKGHVMMRLNALKLERWDQIPEPLRSRIEADHVGEFGDA